MKMQPPRKTAVQQDLVVSEFEGVADELKALIAEENDLLSQGFPVSVLGTIAQKDELSAKYGALGNDLVDHSSVQILSDSALQEKLLETTTQLLAMTEENRQLLCNALAATRRRVDNVMEAIRNHEDDAPSPGDPLPFKRR
jgi:flagellar biosynthesis/type III secretory pathway chaperone